MLLMSMGKSQCTNAGMHERILCMLAAKNCFLNQLSLEDFCVRLLAQAYADVVQALLRDSGHGAL